MPVQLNYSSSNASDNNSNNLGNRVNKCQEDWACLAKGNKKKLQLTIQDNF